MENNPRLRPLYVAALRLRVSSKWLERQARAGRVPCIRAGRQILCDPEAVEAALLERARKQPKAIARADRVRHRGDQFKGKA